jgi:sporulation protein YlmC with PRC-barrel domain
MLRRVKELQGYTIRATDGDIGHVDEFYFDDEKWTVRYLVVDTGGWLSGRQVLISPIALGEANWQERRLHVKLTRQQVENSPDIDTDRPVSRRQEIGYFQYYGWPYYWGGPGIWGGAMVPGYLAVPAAAQEVVEEERRRAEQEGDPHLRSTKDVTGYTIQARDGEIGQVSDFILDDESWTIRYLVVDTGGWLPGKKVLVPPPWIEQVSWAEAAVSVDLSRDTIKNGPEWDPDAPISREYEERLHGYYGRSPYWALS